VIDDLLYSFAVNTISRIRGKLHRLHYDRVAKLFYVQDASGDKIWIARRNRHNRYKKGIEFGVSLLAVQYGLERFCKPGTVLIDCGANIGELGYWAYKNNVSYIGFEPERVEFAALERNTPQSAVLKKGHRKQTGLQGVLAEHPE